MFYALRHVVDSFVNVGKNTPKKSPAGEVRRGSVAAQNPPAGNLQKRCCTNFDFWGRHFIKRMNEDSAKQIALGTISGHSSLSHPNDVQRAKAATVHTYAPDRNCLRVTRADNTPCLWRKANRR
jgi:hypothetical protein